MTVPIDDVFDRHEIAELYDLFNPWMASDDFYLDRARRGGGDVLDVGCGTGMLACRIARESLTVVGADPAAGMLAVARTRDGADTVQWVNARAEDLDLGRRFKTIYMTGHAFQAIIDDDTAVDALAAMAGHLESDGAVIFETRNPAREEWRDWTPAAAPAEADSPALGRVLESYDTRYDAETGIADLTHMYDFPASGRRLVGTSRLRFRPRAHVARLAAAAGLAPQEWLGDWSGAPCTETSKEIIVVAGRSTP